MEEKERERDAEEDEIVVESKKFLCVLPNGGVVLKELNKRGESDLNLNLEQARWIIKGLLERKLHFGGNKRKDSRTFGRKIVILIEGGNRNGCYLSIQVKSGTQDSSNVIVPAGSKSHQWDRVAHPLSGAIKGVTLIDQLGNSPRLNLQSEASSGSNQTNQVRSYAGALKNQSIYTDRGRMGITYDGKELKIRLKALEIEVVELRYRLDTVAAVENPNLIVRKMQDGRQIELNQRTR